MIENNCLQKNSTLDLFLLRGHSRIDHFVHYNNDINIIILFHIVITSGACFRLSLLHEHDGLYRI